MTTTLARHVAVVVGATRGAGRGVARALGERGATVICAGRTSRQGHSDAHETIEETAELVSAAGGTGIAAVTDFADSQQVQRLFQQVEQDHGRLDILINSAWGGDDAIVWDKPFWQQDVDTGQAVVTNAVFTHLRAARHAIPLMLASAPLSQRLIVSLTDGDSPGYRGTLYYDLAKASVSRLSFALSRDLRDHTDGSITSLAASPGFLRSEAMLRRFGVTEATYKSASDPDFVACSETPLFLGRGIAALASAAPDAIKAYAGRTTASWSLARAFPDVTDADGARPMWDAHFLGKYGAVSSYDDIADALARGPMDAVMSKASS